MNKLGAFRYTYFTRKYSETCFFYEHTLGLNLEHDWDRNEYDKGSLFKAGKGLIEVLLHPENEEHKYNGLDYREPQGVFICIQTWEVDDLFEKFKTKGVPFKQKLTIQPWGHKSFSIMEPNGLILFFFEEQF